MRIAVTGVSGFIGSVLTRRLSEAGHAVSGLIRESSRQDHIEPYVDRFVIGDHADPSCWMKLLHHADAVVHNSVDWPAFKDESHLQKNLLSSIQLLDASAPLPFVFVSTIAVHHEICPRWQGMIDEAHPLKPASRYGAYKAAVEAFLHCDHLRNGRKVSTVRPSGVYGIDPDLPRSQGYGIVQTLRKTGSFQRTGGGKFVHVDDVVATIVACLEGPKADTVAYNLADCYARWGDWASIAAEEMGLDAQIDLSGPTASTNQFSKLAVNRLGVAMNRGQEGIRNHLRQLIPLVA